MAAVMAECLEQVVTTSLVEPDAVPAGVYQDARRFWSLALQATEASVPANPPASLNAYVIASDTLLQSSPEVPNTRDDIDRQLKRYETFLERLQQPGKLDHEEIRLATSLQGFFVRLKEEGESEAYTKSMYLEPVPTGFPLR